MNTSIWKWGNTAHITKMGIEGTVALASLAAAITTVLIATNIVAVPESLAFISTIVNPNWNCSAVYCCHIFHYTSYFFVSANVQE
ncbi:MAG: hypothetical protein ACEY3A_00070 [Wolbachia sp.]